ncbi:MAG TPA: hypothetical protein VMH31_03800 [Methylomirabilota bacterium]|nr:hypothetical protein [Methylomirabilota bacterium]
MTYSHQAWAPFLLTLFVSINVAAQAPDNAAVVQGPSAIAAVPKPVRKSDQVITNDTIGLLAVRRAPRVLPASPVPPATPAVAEENAKADAAARKAAEIAALEKQIQEKQKRIALLMKLFVDDEREFLKYGGAAEANPVAQERRRYEQDELRWETAELAKMKAGLELVRAENRK